MKHSFHFQLIQLWRRHLNMIFQKRIFGVLFYVSHLELSTTFLLFYPLQVFRFNIWWWFFTEVWVTASLFRFSGFFSVFWLSTAVVWMILILLPISKCSNSLTNNLGTVPSTSATIDIIVSHIFQCFLFTYLARSNNFSVFCIPFIFTPWSAETAKSTKWHVFLVN